MKRLSIFAILAFLMSTFGATVNISVHHFGFSAVNTAFADDGVQCVGKVVVPKRNMPDLRTHPGVPYFLKAGAKFDWDVNGHVLFAVVNNLKDAQATVDGGTLYDNGLGLTNVGYVLRTQHNMVICVDYHGMGDAKPQAGYNEGAHDSVFLQQSWRRGVQPVSARPCYPSNGCDYVVQTIITFKGQIERQALQNPDGLMLCNVQTDGCATSLKEIMP